MWTNSIGDLQSLQLHSVEPLLYHAQAAHMPSEPNCRTLHELIKANDVF